MKLKCIVLENSIKQQKIMEKMVNCHPNLELSGVYNNALEANRHIKNSNIDLMFLSVDMP